MKIDYVVSASIVYDLSDAKENLGEIIKLFDPQKEIFDEDEFKIQMAHLYWHINPPYENKKYGYIDKEGKFVFNPTN